MTAVNVVLRKDKAIMLTDGLFYTGTGLATGVSHKAFAMPTMKAVVAVRGMQRVGATLAMALPMQFASIDDAIAAGGDFFGGWVGDMVKAIRQSPIPDVTVNDEFDIVLCGWSDAMGKPRGCYYSTRANPRFDELDGWGFGPMPSELEFCNLARLNCEIDRDFHCDDFDGEVHGIPLLEAQRRMKLDPELSSNPRSYAIVGGNVLLTEIDAAGITQRIIHRWDDELGNPIKVEPFDPNARWPGHYKAAKLAARHAKRQRHLQ